MYRSGVRDPIPTYGVSDFYLLISSIFNSALEVYTEHPDVTEIRVEDDQGVTWFLYRYRLDQESTNELRQEPESSS